MIERETQSMRWREQMREREKERKREREKEREKERGREREEKEKRKRRERFAPLLETFWWHTMGFLPRQANAFLDCFQQHVAHAKDSQMNESDEMASNRCVGV